MIHECFNFYNLNIIHLRMLCHFTLPSRFIVRLLNMVCHTPGSDVIATESIFFYHILAYDELSVDF